MDFLRYWFYPNPGNTDYGNWKVQVLMVLCALLVIGSFGIRAWRNRQQNSVTKRLSRSWPSAALWFGLTGLILVVSRVELIQFLAMRFFWVVWIGLLIAYLILQVRLFRARHYQVLPRESVTDPRDPYLPGPRRR